MSGKLVLALVQQYLFSFRTVCACNLQRYIQLMYLALCAVCAMSELQKRSIVIQINQTILADRAAEEAN